MEEITSEHVVGEIRSRAVRQASLGGGGYGGRDKVGIEEPVRDHRLPILELP